MKSFASVMMGIAMIAVVVPVEYVLLFAAEPLEDHRCERVSRDPAVFPEEVFCDFDLNGDGIEDDGGCNATQQTHFFSYGNCVPDPSEDSPNCEIRMEGVMHRSFPIDAIDKGHVILKAELGMAGTGGFLCYLGAAAAGAATGVGGLVVAVLCATAAGAATPFILTNAMNVCEFIECKRNFEVPTIPGPPRPMCD